jgi:polyisoprenoid-binding protein YceI
MRQWSWALAVASVLASWSSSAWAEPHTYTIDRENSQVVVHVGKTGLFGFAGHEHEIRAPLGRGTLIVDPAHVEKSSADLRFDARTLRVVAQGEPVKDVPKVQEAMLGPECLDVGRFPEITFVARTIGAKGSARGGLEASVAGTLTLHGVARDLTAPVHVVVGDDLLSATAILTLKQTDFGIKPISVAGVVKVKDELRIELTLVARRAR